MPRREKPRRYVSPQPAFANGQPRQCRILPHFVARPHRTARNGLVVHDARGSRELADDDERKRTVADRPTEGEEDPFELWLRQSLHEVFDAALEEPVPEDVLRLIEEDRAERERIRRRRRAARRGG